MPTSATGPISAHCGAGHRSAVARRGSRRGFTLLEVLVVMAIVAVVASLAVLSTGGLASRRSDRAAERAQALVELACDRALATGRDVGMAVLPEGLRFGYLVPQGFQPIRDDPADPLRPRALGEGLRLTLWRDGEPLQLAEDPPGSAQVACLASGELTPFELLVEDQDSRWRLRGSLDGTLSRERVDGRR